MSWRTGLTIFSIIVICALLCSGVGLATHFNRASTEITAAPDPYQPMSTPSVSDDENPVNILIVCEENSIANDIYVLNYTPETGVANFLIIPGNTKTIYGTKLNSVAAEKGTIALIDYLKINFNLNIRYYLKFDYTAFKTIVDSLDGVSYNLPTAFRSETTNLGAGTQVYSGDMAVALFRFTQPQGGLYTKELEQYYDGTPYARTLLHADFITALLTQKGNATYIPRITNIVAECGTRIETNITAEEWLALIAQADTVSTKKITQYILSGTEETGGNEFFVSNGRIREMELDREYPLSEATNSIFWSISLR